jgi:NAD(P)-dependent dehydrogenase (short-subunit alcohol dehydrogenase family)
MDTRVALITGSTRGIGLAIAIKLLEEGFHMILNGVTSGEIPDETKASIEAAGITNTSFYEYVQANVGEPDGRQALLDGIDSLGGRIDMLVNNAGIGPPVRCDVLDLAVDDYRQVMQTNLEGPFFLTQSVAKLMLATIEACTIDGYAPCIVNISSISAYTASVNRAAYCISKAGMGMMTSLFASRLGGSIPVHEVRPGIIETDMTRPVLESYAALVEDGLLPAGRLGTPDDVAEAVVAIARGHLPYSTGTVIDVDGGFHLRRL